MKRISVRFERDESLEEIEILVRAPERDAEVASLLERLSEGPPDALTATDAGGVQCRILVGDVVSLSVSGNQTQLVTEKGSYTLRQTLQSLESALDARQFVRISRYELVNLRKIRKFDFTLSGTLRLELAGGTETWASRRCIPAIRKRLTGKE